MYKNYTAYIWFLIFFLIMPVQANSFDDLNNAFVSNVSQLPVIDDGRLKPDKVEQASGHIRGWMDIVGFQEIVKVNGTEINYIDGLPVDKAIVRYDSWAKIDVPVCSISIKNGLTKTISGSNTIANLNIKLTWESKHCNKNGCTCVEHIESAAFFDSEQSPIQYPNSSTPILTLHEFPNSSKALLEVSVDDTVTSYNITTTNGSVKKHIQIGRVEYTTKGVPFANFSKDNDFTIWDDTGKGVYHQGNDVTIDSNNFSFSASTPFGTSQNTNITRIQEQPTSMSCLNILVFIMLGLGYLTCKLAWKVSRI
jgi:hypothetical protein